MKTKISTFIIGCLALLIACEKDGSFLKVSGLQSSDLVASETSIVLTKQTASSSVLALSWSKSTLSVSDASMSLPNSLPKEILEISSKADFDTIISITPQSNTYAFTGTALNTLGKNLKFKAGISTPMYFRIRSSLAVNTDPFYSDVITVNVTCYTIDMSIGFILDSKKADTGFKLYSPNSNGQYYGFVGVAAWYNWYLLEGDDTMWGNLGVDGNAFVLSSESTQWNLWYPGQSGCYYTTFDRTAKGWTATYIPALTVSGDVNATMTFDKQAVKWSVSFTTTTDNANLKVKCTNASQYNKTTGDAASVTKTIGFIPHSDSTLTIDLNSESAGNITIPKAGDYTLTFSLDNPKSWTYQVKKGKAVVVEPLSKFLYLPGIDDGISGSWTFDNYLNLVSETDSTFAGVIMVNSKYGYKMGLESGNWDNVYTMGSTEGTLVFKGTTNITAPNPGLYLIQADLKHLTYSHTAINEIYIGGLNDVWDFTSVVLSKSSAGVYSGTATITKASTNGIRIYVDQTWNHYFGGSFGSVSYLGNNITDDQSLANGTYNVTVDFIDKKCSFVAK